jgi:tetratricopeptide (TPR) repeat protein
MLIRSFAACTLFTLIATTGCNPGHGKTTSEALKRANERQMGMKAANEYDQAKQCYFAGEMDKADKYINKCIQLNPAVPKSYVLKGRIQLEKGDLEQALLAFQKAEALEPRDIESQYYQGIVYERFSKLDLALTHFTAAADAEPSNAQYAVAVAETQVDLGQLDEAEKFLTSRAASFEHNAGIKQSLGHIAMLRKDYEKAVTIFNEARLLASDDSTILEDLVHAQIQTGRYADAEFNLARLLKMEGNKDRRDLLQTRARCLTMLDRPLEARDVLILLTDGDEGQRDVEAWIELGNCCYAIKDMNRTRQAWQRITAIAPERSEGWVLKALYQRKTGDSEGALKTISRAVERRGESVDPLILQGLIYRDLGQSLEARTCFTLALNEQPDNDAAQKALGSFTSETPDQP